MEKEHKNNPYRQMGDRFSYSVPPKTLMNFGESTIDSKGSAKETPIHSDLLCSQTVTNSKKRVLIDSSASLTTDMGVIEDTNYSDLKRKKTGIPDEDTDTTVALGHSKTVDTLVSNIACRRHFYSYDVCDNYANEPQLSCAICRSKVLTKFLELHAWMHLSWIVQVGNRHPFQCTHCDFAAFRIPDVVCHTKETHGNMGTNLFVPTVPHEILQFFFKKVMECFPPMNGNNE